MRITLRQLDIFRAIAFTGSTCAAAQSVPLSQSATSTALGELEHNLTALLFDRIGKRLLLNDNGRALLPMALAVLDGARNIEAAFGSSGRRLIVNLRLFASTTLGNYILPKLLARYRETVPMAHLDVRIGNTLDVITAVKEFSADLGFIEGPCHEPDISIRPWLEDELLIVAAPAHPLAKAKVTIRQLREAPWLLREPGSGTREAVELALLPHLVNIQPAMTLGSSEAIKNLVAEGLGVSCLSRSVVQDSLSAGRLRVLKTSLPRLLRRTSIIYHRSKLLSEPLSNFMRHCESYHG